VQPGAPAAFRAVVRGKVQGVGFRDYAAGRARFLGLVGYARNLADPHAVEVVAEGSRRALDQLLDHLRDGPAAARVDSVDVDWRDPSGAFEDFRIAW
jgi:acylphosphatase